MAGERFFQGIYFDNLGITLSSGVITVKGGTGRDLSAANPSVIVLLDGSLSGEFTRYNVTSNQSFQDSNGTSDIIGNTFGFTSGTAVADSVPFFLYAVSNDSLNSIKFMISRIPGQKTSPASGIIGMPSTANATDEKSFFSFEDITATQWDSNPCRMIGSLLGTMNTSDDWAFTAVAMDYYMQNNDCLIPYGQFGSNSGSVSIPNGGTPPSFGIQSRFYKIDPWNQIVTCGYRLSGDKGTDGSGTVSAQFIVPFLPHADAAYSPISTIVSSVQYQLPGGNKQLGAVSVITNQHYFQIARDNNVNEYLQWADFTDGADRGVWTTFSYPIDFN
jgi:hypothetical protein